MPDEKRVIEISIEAQISDVTKSFTDLATQADLTATRLENSGRKIDKSIATQSRSVGLLGRTMASYTNGVTKLGGISKDLDKQHDKLSRVSTGLLTMGAGFAIGVGLAVAKTTQFESAMSKVASTGDDAKMSLAGLRDSALQAGKATQFTAKEAADGITNMLKASMSAKDIIAGGLTGSLNLAAAGELAVADAAEFMSTALVQFKLPGSQASHVADLLAAGAGKAQGSVTDLANALKFIGPVASGMGVSIEETVGALSALANQGIIGEQAGTGLRGVLMSLTSPSRAAKKEIARLGIEMYDSKGKFLGMTNAAGQLKKAYAGATDEAKDLSLGIIFGNAQVTTARVLFAAGAEGVQEWVNKVNDAGYAARAAATLMDNLGGDVEKLGGSLETVAIQSGSGLNTMLRNTVKGAESTVNAIGGIPAPVLEAGTRMAALAGIGLLVGGGLLKAATGAAQAHQSMALLRKESPKLAAGLDTTAKVAKRATIAMVALQVASIVGSTIQANIDKATGSLGDMAEAAANVGTKSTLDDLDAQFRRVQKWGAPTVASLGDALGQLTASTQGLNAVGTGISNVVQPLFGMKSLPQMLSEQFDKLDQSLTTMDPTTAQAAFQQITASAIAQGVSMDDLLLRFPQYKSTLQSTATTLGITDLAAKDYVEWMGGKVPVAVQLASAAHPDLVNKLTDTQKAAAGGAQSIDDYVKSLYAAADAELALSGKQIGFEAGIDKADKDTGSLVKKAKKKGKFADLTNIDTGLGREAKTILDQLATSSNNYTKSLIENGGSQEEVRLAVARARVEFVKEATDMGFSEQAANDLADARGLIPEDVKLEYSDEGTEAATIRTQVLADSIRNLPKKAKTKVESAFEEGGIDAAYTALAEIDGEAADAFIKSILKKGGIDNWDGYKPKDKHPKIVPSLTKTNFKIRITASGSFKIGNVEGDVADGGLFTKAKTRGLVRSFADGGFSSSIGAQQPQIRTNQGLAGVRWAETGSGPWEAFISGHPAKRDRSRTLASEVVGRLGGVAQFADGGFLDKGVPWGRRDNQVGSSGPVTNINVVNHYPQSEPTSVTVNRAQQLAAALGR